MPNEEPDLELEDDDEIEEDPAEFAAFREELEKRCVASNIAVEEHVDFIGKKYLTVALPSGREKRLVHLADARDIQDMLSMPFERYVFLGGYHSICSYRDFVIEAGIRALVRAMPTQFLFRWLLGRPVANAPDEVTILSSRCAESLMTTASVYRSACHRRLCLRSANRDTVLFEHSQLRSKAFKFLNMTKRLSF